MVFRRVAHRPNLFVGKTLADKRVGRQNLSRINVVTFATVAKPRVVKCRNNVDHIGIDRVMPGELQALGYDGSHVVDIVCRVEMFVTRNYLPFDVGFNILTYLNAHSRCRLKLRCESELYILEIVLSQRECITRIGKEDVAAVLVDSHIGVLATLEVGQLLGVVALYPAGLVD